MKTSLTLLLLASVLASCRTVPPPLGNIPYAVREPVLDSSFGPWIQDASPEPNLAPRLLAFLDKDLSPHSLASWPKTIQPEVYVFKNPKNDILVVWYWVEQQSWGQNHHFAMCSYSPKTWDVWEIGSGSMSGDKYDKEDSEPTGPRDGVPAAHDP